jgi:hypothetical protein
MKTPRSLALTISLALFASIGGVAVVTSPADAASGPAWTKNCTALNRKYPHGVGRKRAHDHTSGTPVTSFKHSNKLYAKAMRYNKGLDRDKDKIACEKR